MAMSPAQSAAHEAAFHSGDWSSYNRQYPASGGTASPTTFNSAIDALSARGISIPAATPAVRSPTQGGADRVQPYTTAQSALGSVPPAPASSYVPQYNTAASALSAAGVNIPTASPLAPPAAPTPPPAAPPPGGTTGGFGSAGNVPPPPGSGTNPPPTSTNSTGYSQTNFNPALTYQPWYYTPREGDASTYAAQQMQVTPDMMVNERVAQLMKSPVGLMAMDVAREYMNSRGMMDSSAAIQAITRAAIQAGLPIAEKDAATYFAAANENLAAENIAREHAASSRNTMESLNVNAYNTAEQAQMQAYNRSREFGIETQFTDYWNRQEMAENARQFNAEDAIKRLQLDVQYAQTAQQTRTAKMAFIMEMSAANLSGQALGQVLNTAVGIGLFTQYEADVIYGNMPGSITSPAEVA